MLTGTVLPGSKMDQRRSVANGDFDDDFDDERLREVIFFLSRGYLLCLVLIIDIYLFIVYS